MSKYRVHNITVRKEDSEKADAIIEKYQKKNYFDDMHVESRSGTVTYWLNLYVSDDLDTIKKELKEAGIQVL